MRVPLEAIWRIELLNNAPLFVKLPLNVAFPLPFITIFPRLRSKTLLNIKDALVIPNDFFAELIFIVPVFVNVMDVVSFP